MKIRIDDPIEPYIEPRIRSDFPRNGWYLFKVKMHLKDRYYEIILKGDNPLDTEFIMQENDSKLMVGSLCNETCYLGFIENVGTKNLLNDTFMIGRKP